MKKCNKASCILSVLAVFLFLEAYSYIVHGHLLMGLYEQTASLWRSQEEMQALLPGIMLKNVLLALVFTWGFKKCRKCKAACNMTTPATPACDPAVTCCPIKSGGLCYGMFIGLLLGIPAAAAYIYMPIPPALAIAWLIAGFFEGVGAGIVLGIFCRMNKAECNAK